MSILPTDPIYSKLLVTTIKPEYHCIRKSICIIVSMLSVENIFLNSFINEKEILQRRQKLLNNASDHLSLLKIYMAYEYVLKTQGKG